jgi:putative phosphoribosyl transferase
LCEGVVEMTRFADRRQAGAALGERLARMRMEAPPVVLALPRGGVPVGFEVARALRAPLDPLLVRKLGVPGHEELAMGAIARGGTRVVNEEVLEMAELTYADVDRVAEVEQRELQRRERAYRGDRPPVELAGRTAILVDDGLATGSSMRAAIEAVRAERPKRVVVAVPVAARSVCEALGQEVDAIVCLHAPEQFYSVGLWYDDFSQTTDEEVLTLLARAAFEAALESASPQAPDWGMS